MRVLKFIGHVVLGLAVGIAFVAIAISMGRAHEALDGWSYRQLITWECRS
jgi:hypothetical protein